MQDLGGGVFLFLGKFFENSGHLVSCIKKSRIGILMMQRGNTQYTKKKQEEKGLCLNV